MDSSDRKGFHEHRSRVRDHLNPALFGLMRRGSTHDAHLLDPERAKLEPHASYEPEAHTNGVQGMTILDLLQMLATLKALSEAVPHSFAMALESFIRTYKVPEDLANLLRRSAIEFFWAQADELTEVRKLLVDGAK